jgi:DNA-binding MarR family transcriptional regulator
MAVRIWLLLQAAYQPDRETILPRDTAVRILKGSSRTVSAGFAELLAAGIVTKLREPCRPGTMGALGVGRATVFDLPDRRGVTGLWKALGDPWFEGYWRIDVGALRRAATDLSGPEAKLWVHLHARHRRSDGGPVANEPMSLGASSVAEALHLTRPTAARAIAGLSRRGFITLERSAAGSAPALFRLSDAQTKGASSRKSKSNPKPSPYSHETQA